MFTDLINYLRLLIYIDIPKINCCSIGQDKRSYPSMELFACVRFHLDIFIPLMKYIIYIHTEYYKKLVWNHITGMSIFNL